MSKHNTVKFELVPKVPAPLTAEQRKRLARIAAMPDSAIYYSDIPQHPRALAFAEGGQSRRSAM